MGLNQTSPPSSTPVNETKGDGSCEIDVTYVAIDGVTLLICLCGLVGNGAVLWLLGFHIRRNNMTIYILNLAVADFIFLLFIVSSFPLFLLEDVYCSTAVSLKYLRSLLLLSLFSYNTGLYLLTAISIERCASILFPLWYRCRRPQCLSWVVCALLWALSIAVMVVVTSLCLSHDHKHECEQKKCKQCQVSLISMYALSFLVFAPPMVISNVIIFIKVLCVSKRRQSKRLYIVIFLTVLFFLIFGVPLSLWNFLWQMDYVLLSSQVVFLLACINSSINPFIYFFVGGCLKRCSIMSLQVAIRRVFEETGTTTTSS